MGPFTYNETSMEGEIFIQRVSTYIRRNEEALANGLVFFLKARTSTAKPVRLQFTLHHLYYISERIQQLTLGVDVGALNIKLDSPNHEPTFISFMANNARLNRTFDADTRSILSINSMKLIVSSASIYWRSVGFSKDPKVIVKDMKYIYSLFTKIPCLVLSPKTKMNLISGYEEYPCDTAVPVVMFKNLQVLEVSEYEPNEIFGWHVLASQLRILVVKNSKISDLGELIFNLVIDDESGRSSFNSHRRKVDLLEDEEPEDRFPNKRKIDDLNVTFSNEHNELNHLPRERSLTMSSVTTPPLRKDYNHLLDDKWSFLKQLTVCEASITTIQPYIWKPLSNLVKLNLSSNLLEAIPEGLDELVNLRYLNFADNLITDLTGLPCHLKQLQTLNLNNNKLTSLNGLNNLMVLEKIDLRRNKLKDMNSLKPVVLQFIKNPDKFNNVYLANNSLPKHFRIDLFNLFNGIKFKNQIKIDDSRPGYFESALLLDAESAFKVFEEYFGFQNKQPNKGPKASVVPHKPRPLPLLLGNESPLGISRDPMASRLSSAIPLLPIDQASPRAYKSKASSVVGEIEASLQNLLIDSRQDPNTSVTSNSTSRNSTLLARLGSNSPSRASLPLSTNNNLTNLEHPTKKSLGQKTPDTSINVNNHILQVISPVLVTASLSA